MEVIYGSVICEGMKSNNWKRMHGVPLKTKVKNQCGEDIIIWVPNKYVSKRSKKKQKKAHFQNSFNPMVESYLSDKPDLKRIYRRYGYMYRKYRRKFGERIPMKLKFRNKL